MRRELAQLVTRRVVLSSLELVPNNLERPTLFRISSLKHNSPHKPEAAGLSSYPLCKHKASVQLHF
jgi:hypothetical protein